VREYERRGVAGLHIEDQGFPKKCGHLENKVIVSLDVYLAKIRAAVAAKRDPAFFIIARTDSRAVLGFEEARGQMGDDHDQENSETGQTVRTIQTCQTGQGVIAALTLCEQHRSTLTRAGLGDMSRSPRRYRNASDESSLCDDGPFVW
jgi:isocitrate lyase